MRSRNEDRDFLAFAEVTAEQLLKPLARRGVNLARLLNRNIFHVSVIGKFSQR